MCEMAAPATLDGGDVLRIGRILVVGISSRTNKAGVRCLEQSFPYYAVVPVPVRDGLHLKSFMSQCGSRHVRVGAARLGTAAWPALARGSGDRGGRGEHCLTPALPCQLAVADTEQGRSAARAIEHVCPGEVAFVMVHHAAAANCLWVNGALVHRAEAEYANDIMAILAGTDATSTHALTAGELQKVDGLLTCSSVLLER